MRAAQRLESIGRLAGGIAHDFNNLLLIIQSSAQFLEHKLGSLPAVRLDLQMITESAPRASESPIDRGVTRTPASDSSTISTAPPATPVPAALGAPA